MSLFSAGNKANIRNKMKATFFIGRWFLSVLQKGNLHDGTCLNGDTPYSSLSSHPVLWHDQGGWAIAESGCAGLPSSRGGRDQPGRLRHECQRWPGCGSVSNWPLNLIRPSTGTGHSSLVEDRRTISSFTRYCRARKRCIPWRYQPRPTLPRACSISQLCRSHSKAKGLPPRLASRHRWSAHVSS